MNVKLVGQWTLTMKRNAIYPFRPSASKRIRPQLYTAAVAVSQFSSLRIRPVFLAPRIELDIDLLTGNFSLDAVLREIGSSLSANVNETLTLPIV